MPKAKPSKRKPKFHKGQVVMVTGQYGPPYPVKLERLTTIGDAETSGFRWFDTLGNVEYENRMRRLTAREKGWPDAERTD